ncbi:hypothetical protein GOHSU_02_00670 [Gordonia hirsuta DSM 44140 = NBRC 16056]|uniref:Plasmid pRiA4b Orf3-like domain-containing protein n=1 Tax=Gordonia hirsuta DSM 44140 = NBRC 16056 TaxID=1121927 RepID=L7L4Q0_9ACTN|nr:plasmid pRiA4b ORF-3 family protein [Gordonia hirsuta]GAC55924.1 hypothetical protein GOHSU_02_00670 [Gordonia hirsuta DSM 44140 = NBRC 16056]
MASSLITLHVELEEAEPPITRDLQVDGELSLAQLHTALQIVFDWREEQPHLFGNGHGRLEPEDQMPVAAALADGPLWYDYDPHDRWGHRLTGSAPTAALGSPRPVSVLGGTGRGPIEGSGGPRGYAEKLAVLADPEHPDHAVVADWVRAVTGPWFTPDPDLFDAGAAQAELDLAFGFRADERDPHDLSGLVLADDLRGPGDLAPEALLADFAANLPAGARSEFRRYVYRTGLLEPVQVSAQVRAQLTAPFGWFLEAVGTDGLPLTANGRLPSAVVDDAVAVLDWDRPRPQQTPREPAAAAIPTLHRAATRLGLVRPLHGRLVRTGHGERAAGSPTQLWAALTTRILTGLTPGAQVAATALLLTCADRPPIHRYDDQSWRDIAFALGVCGWRPRDRSADFDRDTVHGIVAPIHDVLDSLGSPGGTAGCPLRSEPDPHLSDFARAVLHGPAAIRSALTTRHR